MVFPDISPHIGWGPPSRPVLSGERGGTTEEDVSAGAVPHDSPDMGRLGRIGPGPDLLVRAHTSRRECTCPAEDPDSGTRGLLTTGAMTSRSGPTGPRWVTRPSKGPDQGPRGTHRVTSSEFSSLTWGNYDGSEDSPDRTRVLDDVPPSGRNTAPTEDSQNHRPLNPRLLEFLPIVVDKAPRCAAVCPVSETTESRVETGYPSAVSLVFSTHKRKVEGQRLCGSRGTGGGGPWEPLWGSSSTSVRRRLGSGLLRPGSWDPFLNRRSVPHRGPHCPDTEGLFSFAQ